MNRRDFLKALGLTLAPLAPNLALAVAPEYSNLLILVELKGGNDGVNTVIPYADSEYYTLRSRLAVSRDQVLQLDQRSGLHPALKLLLPLWQKRELAIVQGVGYPQPNLSHFRSIEIWDTASAANEYLDDGWLTRVFAASPAPRAFAADGVVVGSPEIGPLTGGARVIALADIESFLRQSRLVSDKPRQSENPMLAHILKVEADIQQAASVLRGNHAFKTEFPQAPFGKAVRTAAEVIASKSGIAVLRITQAGYDTHSNQANVHARLLTDLADGLTALKSALVEINRWDSTLIMTYSEFGRRPRDNQSNGTDHGTASAHFVLGGRVAGGIYGQAPQLNRLDGNGNLSFAVDFRSLYATAIEKWWGMPSDAALGGKFTILNLIKT